jgi:hypothetical protein
MTTWTVTRTDGEGPWEIHEDGHVTETVPGHYDVDEVLRIVGDASTWPPPQDQPRSAS